MQGYKARANSSPSPPRGDGLACCPPSVSFDKTRTRLVQRCFPSPWRWVGCVRRPGVGLCRVARPSSQDSPLGWCPQRPCVGETDWRGWRAPLPLSVRTCHLPFSFFLWGISNIHRVGHSVRSSMWNHPPQDSLGPCPAVFEANCRHILFVIVCDLSLKDKGFKNVTTILLSPIKLMILAVKYPIFVFPTISLLPDFLAG